MTNGGYLSTLTKCRSTDFSESSYYRDASGRGYQRPCKHYDIPTGRADADDVNDDVNGWPMKALDAVCQIKGQHRVKINEKDKASLRLGRFPYIFLTSISLMVLCALDFGGVIELEKMCIVNVNNHQTLDSDKCG